jgi:hypothetical protein
MATRQDFRYRRPAGSKKKAGTKKPHTIQAAKARKKHMPKKHNWSNR